MAWRLHLANQAIHHLDLIDGDPPIVAVWLRQDRVAFYHLETGVVVGEQTLEFPLDENRQSPVWRAWIAGLCAPNSARLPAIRTPGRTVYISEDGHLQLDFVGGAELYLYTNGTEVKLDTNGAERLEAVALDRLMGLSAALDQAGQLYIYQQHLRVGIFDVGLSAQEEARPMVAIERGGNAIYATDGRQVIMTDSTGKIMNQMRTHFPIRQMACSPHGRYLAFSDVDVGVIRVYSGKDLTLTHQRFAVDLVAEATQVQLLADMPPASVAAGSLGINAAGVLAFAMSGVVCVSELSHMDEVPRRVAP